MALYVHWEAPQCESCGSLPSNLRARPRQQQLFRCRGRPATDGQGPRGGKCWKGYWHTGGVCCLNMRLIISANKIGQGIFDNLLFIFMGLKILPKPCVSCRLSLGQCGMPEPEWPAGQGWTNLEVMKIQRTWWEMEVQLQNEWSFRFQVVP